ncbi:MAG: hypothetical protein SFW09_18690 [Hyphomicrobiaceae bacterium]|nr:hypothetical protein [Hyphomicrobiaceae bacterium]
MRSTWLAASLILASVPEAAAVDCAKSPTFMKKVPGGLEVAYHPGCEPPPVKAQEPVRRSSLRSGPGCLDCDRWQQQIKKLQYDSYVRRYDYESSQAARRDARHR